MDRKLRILLLAGGDSPERDVSLASAKAIYQALVHNGHNVEVMDPMQPDLSQDQVLSLLREPDIKVNPPVLKGSVHREELLKAMAAWKRHQVDVVFNALHGGAGEDGTFQALLKFIGIPFTGSGSRASMIAMDKNISRRIAPSCGVMVPEGFAVRNKEEPIADIVKRIDDGPGFPVVVKPTDQGSSVGVTIVEAAEGAEEAVSKAKAFGGGYIIERYITGSEITITVLGEEVLPIIEVRPRSGLYDYKHKYMHGITEYVVPAPIGKALAKRFADDALKVFRAFGCSVYGRVDFRLSEDGKPFFLEVNTLPGLTASSLVPRSAKAAGIEFDELVERILEMSLQLNRREN